MSMTDPIADFLARLRNAIIGRKTRVEAPYSRLKEHIAEILLREGFVSKVSVVQKAHLRFVAVELRYDHKAQSAITGLRRVSRPGQRSYVGWDAIPRVRSGMGMSILTTSKGLVTDRQARKLKVGGELICEVW